MPFYKKLNISVHNKKVLRFIVIGLILWPTPFPGLVLFVLPSFFLLDFKCKRGFDKWFWNKTKVGNSLYKQVMFIFKSLDKILTSYIAKLVKKERKAFSIKRLCNKKLIALLDIVKDQSISYKELFVDLKER